MLVVKMQQSSVPASPGKSTTGLVPFCQQDKVKCCVLLCYKYDFQWAGSLVAPLMNAYPTFVFSTVSIPTRPAVIPCLIQSPSRSDRGRRP